MWWNRWCGWSIDHPLEIRNFQECRRILAQAVRHGASITSAITSPVELLEVVRLLEEAIGKKAKRELLPMQPGDVPATYADVDDLMRDVDFRPEPRLPRALAASSNGTDRIIASDVTCGSIGTRVCDRIGSHLAVVLLRAAHATTQDCKIDDGSNTGSTEGQAVH